MAATAAESREGKDAIRAQALPGAEPWDDPNGLNGRLWIAESVWRGPDEKFNILLERELAYLGKVLCRERRRLLAGGAIRGEAAGRSAAEPAS